MSSTALRSFIIGLALVGLGATVQAGLKSESAFTERGKADFDTFLQVLNPYGTWAKIDGKWAFTPTDHIPPYTNGRWVYTEYGWYWQGRAPHSWATEHYGYWKRSADKVWSWYPGPYWLPEIVEFRATTKYIGWRTGEVDSDGSFVESAIERYSKPEEWTFVTLAQFANPITPSVAASPDVAKAQLDDSTDCRHTYLTYRELDRPGPHPADFFDLSRDGGMLAPKTIQDEAAAQAPRPKSTDTNSPASKLTGADQPALVGAPTAINPSADTRQVKYWVTMSLPTFWTKPPEEAKSGEIYIYRPETFQDIDGIVRRISLWFNPKERTTLKELMGDPATALKRSDNPPAATPPRDPFRSPLQDPYHAKPAVPKPVPSGMAPPGTNAPPVNPGLAQPPTSP